MYKRHQIYLCYFILATDHAHYCNQKSYSRDTGDLDFRDKTRYKAGTPLRYKTTKPYGSDMVSSQDYTFRWNKIKGLYFLKIKV